MRAEKHYIQKNHQFFKECDDLAFRSKNLYNYANYLVRQEYINSGKFLNAITLQKLLQGNQIDYLRLPAKVSQATLRLLEKNWVSFFKANQGFKANPEKYPGKPRIPRYKRKNGRNIVIYDEQAILTRKLKKGGLIGLSKTDIEILFINQDRCKKLKQVRIVPINKFQYCIEIVYNEIEQKQVLDPNKVIGIDLGVNNLCSVIGDDFAFIINGKVIKSVNQFYNKEKARLQSWLPSTQKTSNKIIQLTNKRDHKINDYLHKTSRYIVDLCLTKDVGKIVIGYNEGWKKEVNLGKRTNQKFCYIPFLKLIHQIQYKSDIGIEVLVNEESYTSKCSFFDDESIERHKVYKGKRIKRGLFKTSKGLLVNADINGALNIRKKVIPNFKNEGIEALAVMPVRINPYKL